MAATASTIQFARGDARDADAWTLGTPDRAIAIGDKGGRAEEYQPCGHDTHVAMESFLRLPRPRRPVGCRPRPNFFASSRRCSASFGAHMGESTGQVGRGWCRERGGK